MFTLQRYKNNFRNVMFCLLFFNNENLTLSLGFEVAELKEEDMPMV